MIRIWLSFIGSLLAGALFAGGSVEAEVPVGIAEPFSGPTGYGFEMQRSAELAVAELNQAGGVRGEPVRLISVDDACDPDQAVAAAHKLVEAGAVFVIGHSCSHSAIPASKVYEAAGILYMTPAASNPRLTDEVGFTVFRLRGRDDQAAEFAARYLAERWADRRIGIIHDGRIYGRYLAEAVRRRLNEQGIEEALDEAVTPGQLDYSDVVSKLKSARVDVVFFGLFPPEAGLIMRQARDHGVDFQVVAGDSLADEEFQRIAGNVEGTLIMYHPDPTQIAPEATARFIAAYHETFPVEPGAPAIDLNFSPYIGCNLWAEAVEIAGSFEGEAVAQVLHSRTFDTMLGPLSFDDKGDVTGIPMWSWWAWENGEMVEKNPANLPPTK